MSRLSRFRREDTAQDLVEYALLGAFLAFAVVAGIRVMTTSSGARLTFIAQAIHQSSPSVTTIDAHADHDRRTLNPH